MKKYLLIALVALFSVGASAQSASEIFDFSSPKYQADYTLGVFAGHGTLLNFGTTQGAMFGKYLYAGLSLNFEANCDNFEYWNIAPLVSLRGYYPVKENLRLFVNPEFGAAVGLHEDSGSAFEYRMTFGVEYKCFQWGLGFGGAGGTGFFTRLGVVF